jgi:hypothetical protein
MLSLPFTFLFSSRHSIKIGKIQGVNPFSFIENVELSIRLYVKKDFFFLLFSITIINAWYNSLVSD